MEYFHMEHSCLCYVLQKQIIQLVAVQVYSSPALQHSSLEPVPGKALVTTENCDTLLNRVADLWSRFQFRGIRSS